MRESVTRFLVIHELSREDIVGFISWQVDTEDDDAVIYWYKLLSKADKSYELQLSRRSQRSGLGGQLMQLLERIGISLKLSKAMLTVFTSNVSALNFYTSLGYVLVTSSALITRYTTDAISPPPRNLRSGRTIQPDYKILSKRLC